MMKLLWKSGICAGIFLLLAAHASAKVQYFQATAPTGVGLSCESLDGNGGTNYQPLADLDGCFVITSNNELCVYQLDADAFCGSTTTEAPCPKWVKPSSNPGNKCWRLTENIGYQTTGRIHVSNTGLICDTDEDGSCSESDQANWDTAAQFLQFGDSVDQAAMTPVLRLPRDFDPTVDTVSIDVIWTSGSTGGVMWCFQYRHSAFGEAIGSFAGTQCMTASSGTAGQYTLATNFTATTAEVDDWTQDDAFQVLIYRDVDGTGDNLEAIAELVGLSINFYRLLDKTP